MATAAEVLEAAAPATRGTLLSVNNYSYPRGGADVAFLEHNRLLERRGWRVVPFSMSHAKNAATPWSEYFVEEIEFGGPYKPRERVRKAIKAVYSVEARRKVTALIDAVAPTVCHVHNVYHHISPAILSVVRSRGIPLVMTLHDLKLACPAYSMLSHDGVCERCRGGRLYQVLLQRCMKGSAALSALVMVESYLHRLLGSYLRNVDRFIVPSRFFLRKFEEWGYDPSRFVHVPNFIDAAALVPECAPGSRFVYFGRLSREKGLQTLLTAARFAGVGVDIVGTGPEQDALLEHARQIGADARFLGFLSGERLHAAVRAARAVVVPSEWYENAPLSVLEASALGKPIIASGIGGLPELVIADETGWIFQAASADALAGVLRAVRDLSDTQVAAFGERARERVARVFSVERYLAGLLAVYRSAGVEER
jgi:glycosyltransferase involved in cell wall biosynthesis